MKSPTGHASGAGARIVALIVAAGSGVRARGGTTGSIAKQYALLGDTSMLGRSIRAFAAHPRIDAVMPVIGKDDDGSYKAVIDGLGAKVADKLLAPAVGGRTRQQSVASGLRSLSGRGPQYVLIHDAARPFVDAPLIDAVIRALDDAQGAIPVLPMVDTVKRVIDGRVVATEERDTLAAAQTPQGFDFAAILDAHEQAAATGDIRFTDDSGIAEWAGLTVVAVAGDPANNKITTPRDLETARSRLEESCRSMMRVGLGIDVHAFAPGHSVRLCGIDIPHSHSLLGHSDADVGLHALADAIYGAIGEGDIGMHFPPSDEKWKDVDSSVFVRHARDCVDRRGGRIVHVDVTIICEAPKIAPHRSKMVERMGELLGTGPGSVSVKATTSEGLGFTGRGEGIAAQAVATVAVPSDVQRD